MAAISGVSTSQYWFFAGRSSGQSLDVDGEFSLPAVDSFGQNGPNNERYYINIWVNVKNSTLTTTYYSKSQTLWYTTSGAKSGLFIVSNINIDTTLYSFANNTTLKVEVKSGTTTSATKDLIIRQVKLDYSIYGVTQYVDYNQSINMSDFAGTVPNGYSTPNTWTANSTNIAQTADFYPANNSSWFNLSSSTGYIVYFTPVWTKITYNITLNNNGGTGGKIIGSTYQISTNEQTRIISNPTRTGFTFGGWEISPELAGVGELAGTLYIPVNTYGSFTMTAQWLWNLEGTNYAISKYQIGTVITGASSYNADDTLQSFGIGVSLTAGYNNPVVSISRTGAYGGSTPTVQYMTEGTYLVSIPALSYGTFTINAVADLIPYSITYVLNDANGSHANPSSYVVTDIVNLSQGAITKTGYTFAGWYNNPELTGSAITSFTGQTGNKTFYIKWTVISYSISYTLGGSTAFPTSGEHGNPINYDIEDALITFAAGALVRPGWINPIFTPATIPAGSSGNKNTVISWSTQSYTIYLDNNSGSGININSDEYASANVDGSNTTRTLTPPTRAGYTFSSYTITRLGTYGGGTPTISGNTLTIPSGSYGDMEISAVWTGNTNSYSFTSNGITANGNWTTQDTLKEFYYDLNNKTGYQKNGGIVTIQTLGGSTTVSGISSLTITIPANAYGSLEVTGQYTPNTYNIAFNSNGGNTLSNLVATYDVNLGTLPTPVKAGYNFNGWYLEPEFTNLITSTSKNLTTTNGAIITLYAKWTARELTINYSSNGGVGSMTTSVGSYGGNVLVKSNTFTKTGYTFNGWLNSDTLANITTPVANTEYPVTNLTSTIDDIGVTSVVITLTAQWIINQYVVSFEENGGSLVNNITQDYNSSVVKPTNPTKTGYTFNNWYTDAALTTVQTWPFNMPAGGKTLYAKWDINQYTIYFDTNGGNTITAITQSYGSTVIAPANPTKLENVFAGWYADASFTTAYTFSTMPAQNITIFAKWNINQYTLKFVDWNGSILQTANYDFGADLSSVTAPINPTRTGYTFNTWSQTIPATMPANNVTITAIYDINQYTVSFEENGGSVVANITQDYNSSVVKPADPTRVGYTFAGWYLEIGLTTLQTWPFTMPLDGKTLYAKWTVNSYTISIYVNGGSAINNITQNYDTVVTTPTNPTKTGYTFSGWYQEPTLTNAYVFPATMPAFNDEAYAKWTINQYTIVFVENGGSPVTDITQNYNSAVVAPTAPTRTGYTFGGWFTDNGTFANAYTFSTMPLDGITLYAKWNIVTYNITYTLNGGTNGANPATYQVTTATITLLPATRTGYTFNGWYNDSGFTIQVTQIAVGSTGNKTLYAKFTINQYTILFEENGGSLVDDITQDYGTTVTEPIDPTKTGYNFGGWFTSQAFTTLYVFNTMPAANTTAYAKWTEGVFTVWFRDWDGTILQEHEHTFGEDLTGETPPVDPTRTGYAFTGWNASIPSTMPANNITITAQYSINQYTISFEENGGSFVNDITQDYGTNITQPSNPTRNGYTFGGWFTDNDVWSNGYTFTTMPASNVTIYAKWNIITYNITYTLNGSTNHVNNPATYNVESATITLSLGTKVGYTFNGWYDNPTFTGNPVTEIPAGSFVNISLYAKTTINQYTISFVKNDSGFDNNALVDRPNITQNYNTVVTQPSNPIRTGHTFGGYFTDAALTIAYTWPSNMPPNNTTVYLKWTINQYSITFNVNNNYGSTVSTITENWYTDLVQPANPTRPGWVFAGWYTDTGLTTTYTFPSKMPALSRTVYAKWTGITYNITINLNGGSGESNKIFTTSASSQQKSFKIGTDMTKTIINKKHLFSHWEIINNTTHDTSTISGAVLTIPANAYGEITIQARWNVAKRATYIGNTRIEENKLMFGGVTDKIIITDAVATPTVVYEKTLYLEDVE